MTTTYNEHVAALESARNLQELKEALRKAAKAFHPDLNPGIDFMHMAKLNALYDTRVKVLARYDHKGQAVNDKQYAEAVHVAEEYKDLIVQLLKLEGLRIEICGSWIWVGGETFKHKAAIKALGLSWSKNKMMWYWHPEGYKGFKHEAWRIERIRVAYGSQRVSHLDEDETNKPATRAC